MLVLNYIRFYVIIEYMSDIVSHKPELNLPPRTAEAFGIDLGRAKDVYRRQFKIGAPDLYVAETETGHPVRLRVYDNDHTFTFGVSLLDQINEKTGKPERFFVDSAGGHIMILDHAGGAQLKPFDDDMRSLRYAEIFKNVVDSGELTASLEHAEAYHRDRRQKSKLGKLISVFSNKIDI